MEHTNLIGIISIGREEKGTFFSTKTKNAEVAAAAIISNKRKMHLQRPPAILVMSTLHQQIDHENHLTKYVGANMNCKTRFVAALLGNETHETKKGLQTIWLADYFMD